MELDWYCTRGDWYEARTLLGILWFFKRPQMILIEKQRIRKHDISSLITNTFANRVAIDRPMIIR
jgi:hypothetical protein